MTIRTADGSLSAQVAHGTAPEGEEVTTPGLDAGLGLPPPPAESAPVYRDLDYLFG